MSIEWIDRIRSGQQERSITLRTHDIVIAKDLFTEMGSPAYVRVGRDGTALVIEPCDGSEISARKVNAQRAVGSPVLRAAFDVPDGRYAATLRLGRLTAVLS